MHELLQYPFDAARISKKRGSIRRGLLADGSRRLPIKIAVLGGSTTHDICQMLELFLLDVGIEPVFYQSEFGQYWQDAMFPGPALLSFAPEVIFVHTTQRNIQAQPSMANSPKEIDAMLAAEQSRFEQMWQSLEKHFGCPVIQNNFEPPTWRLLGNRDVWDVHGMLHFVRRMNDALYAYAGSHAHFYVHDVAYLAGQFGLSRWAEPAAWHMYKMCPAPAAVPDFAFNLSHIIRSLYGGNKKVLALDLDNTLWGGVVGDDGAEGLAIGHETAMGEVFSEFQQYVKAYKDLGVLLSVVSKNEEENALEGLNHPEGTLRPEDFAAIRANWEPKDRNIADIANELNLGSDSFVFVDDNPAEREIVRQSGLGVAVPEVDRVQDYIDVLDKNGWFEVTVFSADDLQRGEMYAQNAQRAAQQDSFADYNAYLDSLQMQALIRPFEPLYLPRIAQLTGKSNQFNLTTRRYTEAQLADMAQREDVITLYGKLEDKFGDNGVVSVAAAHLADGAAHIDLWLMSCRVLKRGMEEAMMDTFVRQAAAAGASEIYGYYYKTPKNAMVQEFFAPFGFAKTKELPNGDSEWRLAIKDYQPKRPHIVIKEDAE